MNKTIPEGTDLAKAIATDLTGTALPVDVVLCPTATALHAVAQAVSGSVVEVGAQNIYDKPEGAFTGEISAGMIKDAGATYVILGHSERRQYFGETDATVNLKIKAARAQDLTPIVCIGETLDQREAGTTEAIVADQLRGCLAGLDNQIIHNLVLAYEPVWAIGTGKTATPEQAQDVHAFIRTVLTDIADEFTAQAVRIQYGGSMKPANASELLAQPDIDGGLIGGASLTPDAFLSIVNAAQ